MDALPLSLQRLRGTVGLWSRSLNVVAPAQRPEVVAQIDAAGYGALWLPEEWGVESLVGAALALSATTSMTVATGITNIWGRDAVATVNAARTLNAISNDRFVLGLGVSHRPLVERLRGHEYVSPLAHMRDYLAAMDRAPMHAAEGEHPYARVIAALGPKMVALGADCADGVHTYLVDVEHTASTRAALGGKFLAVEQAVVVGVGREEFYQRAHRHLEFYTGLENYRASWARMGFGPDDWVRGGSERLCDAMVVWGGVEEIAARVDDHRRAGADHVCLQVIGPDDAPTREAWREIAAGLGLGS